MQHKSVESHPCKERKDGAPGVREPAISTAIPSYPLQLVDQTRPTA
jgi:hypothetical protein